MCRRQKSKFYFKKKLKSDAASIPGNKSSFHLSPLEFASEEEREAYEAEVRADMELRARKSRDTMAGFVPVSELNTMQVIALVLEDMIENARPIGDMLPPERGGFGIVR